LVDAPDSKSGAREGVRVRFPPPAPSRAFARRIRSASRTSGRAGRFPSQEFAMDDSTTTRAPWPVLDYAQWRDTLVTLHPWTQVVGKLRLALAPWLNHGWQVPLYVHPRGLRTSTIHLGARMLEIDFDIVDHRLLVRLSDGVLRGFALEPMSVARFHRRLMDELQAAGIDVEINTLPNEVPDPIPFPEDEVHASYDAEAAHRFWLSLMHADRVFRLFRTGFVGKSSPVHFFWGSFDLAVTRFSGR